MEKIEAYKAGDGTIFECRERCANYERAQKLDDLTSGFAWSICDIYEHSVFGYDNLITLVNSNEKYKILISQLNKDVNNGTQ